VLADLLCPVSNCVWQWIMADILRTWRDMMVLRCVVEM
jgi:hypothetical protein